MQMNNTLLQQSDIKKMRIDDFSIKFVGILNLRSNRVR